LQLPLNTILAGHVIDRLKELPSQSIDCVVTSPPYYGLRNYQTKPQIWGGEKDCKHFWKNVLKKRTRGTLHGANAKAGNRLSDISDTIIVQGQFCKYCNAWLGELGSEPSSKLFVGHLVDIFREVRRVLKNTGVCFLNLGDCYAGGGRNSGNSYDNTSAKQKTNIHSMAVGKSPFLYDLKPKNMMGIPWRIAFALQDDGWILRRDIIWAKGVSFCDDYSGTVMPESTKDRPSTSHEYVFMLTKKPKYYYDYYAVMEDATPTGIARNKRGVSNNHKYSKGAPGQRPNTCDQPREKDPNREVPTKRNLRSVWTINPEPRKEAHFACFPTKLIIPMIKAGSSECGNCSKCGKPWERAIEKDGKFQRRWSKSNAKEGWQPTCACKTDKVVPAVILDPFFGSGTTGKVAQRLGRHWIGIELNELYITDIAEKNFYQQDAFVTASLGSLKT